VIGGFIGSACVAGAPVCVAAGAGVGGHLGNVVDGPIYDAGDEVVEPITSPLH
jgi:hypothetical protein